MLNPIEDWINSNNLSVTWINDKVFTLDKQDYLVVKSKNGKVVDEDFNLLVEGEELEEILIENYCFQFGGNFYYSSVKAEKTELNPLKYIGQAKDISGYPQLAIHGGYEVCVGSRSYEDWCKKAKFLGIETLGIAEKHTLAGALKFQQAASKAGIKSIIGETLFIKAKEDYHVKLYVKNDIGWTNLLRIHKRLNIDNLGNGVEEDFLLENTEGLYCVFCHDTDLDEISWLSSNYFEKIYFQYDPVEYKSKERDEKCLKALRKFQNKYTETLSLALVTDTYYLDKSDYKVKKILKFVGSGKFEYQSEDQYFKSIEDIAAQSIELFTTKGEDYGFNILENALAGTQEIAEGCDFKIKTNEIHLPKYKLSEEEGKEFTDSQELFWHLVEKGLREKVEAKGKNLQIYMDRVGMEMEVISLGKFEDYFLALADINNWCARNNILVGGGRGSSAGSIISFLLGITKVDAIQYGLIFERFLNLSRVGKGLPDIDCDYPSNRREDVKRYMEERFGHTNVCSIGTYNTLAIKAAFRDVLRLQGISPKDINYYSTMIDKKDESFADLFQRACIEPKLKAFIDENYDAINNIPLVLDQPKSESIHASGVIMAPSEDKDGNPMTIYEWFPCKKIDGILISEWEGTELDSAGFLKADILGLSQLDKLQETVDLTEVNTGIRIDLDELNIKDDNVYQLFKLGLNQDVFQFGTDGLISYCREVKPENVEELAVINALYRPGPMDSGAHNDYVKIKWGKKKPEYDWGTEELLKSTFGILVFQEQAIKMVQALAGFTLTDGDGVRKATGKKDAKLMATYKDQFIKGCVNNGAIELDAIKIWNKIEVFAGYSFNLSHAIAYSLMGYQTQWLKKYYPLEFWTISLQHAKDDEVPKRISEMRKFEGLNLCGPNINTSRDKFYTDFQTNSIYWSLSRIDQVGEKAMAAITEERNANGQFFSLEEFIKRTKSKGVNTRVIKHLILSGCFDELHNIDNPIKRLDLIKEFCTICGLDLPDEFKDNQVYSEFFWYKMQRDLSGFGYFEYGQLPLENDAWHNHDYAEPDDVNNVEFDSAYVVVYGIISEMITRKTKKGEMQKLTIDHNNDLIDVVLWPEQWARLKYDLEDKVGSGIAVNGQVLWDNYNKKNCVYSTQETQIELF